MLLTIFLLPLGGDRPAIVVLGRDFTIDESGMLTLIPIPPSTMSEEPISDEPPIV